MFRQSFVGQYSLAIVNDPSRLSHAISTYRSDFPTSLAIIDCTEITNIIQITANLFFHVISLKFELMLLLRVTSNNL